MLRALSRFDRALVELQVGLKVLPIGVAQTGAWNYAFVYEILQLHFPDLPAKARSFGRGEARRVLVQRYLDNVVAADRKMARFKKEIEGLRHPQPLSTRVLKDAS